LRFALDVAVRQFEGLMHGSAMTHITQPMMKLVRVPVPSKERQVHIAAELTDEWRLIDEATEMMRKQIDLLREHRQALITAAVSGQLDFSKAAA